MAFFWPRRQGKEVCPHACTHTHTYVHTGCHRPPVPERAEPRRGRVGGGRVTAKSAGGGGEGDDVKTPKPRLSLVVIGHVDAGKSTLMGQVSK